MHPAIERLTPAEALDLVDSPFLFEAWLDENDVPRSREVLRLVWELAEACLDAPSSSDWRRRDADRLRAFVQRAVGLPIRQRQVAKLCLDHGLSITACARELGISRETVRTHLRRLRATERRCTARDSYRE